MPKIRKVVPEISNDEYDVVLSVGGQGGVPSRADLVALCRSYGDIKAAFSAGKQAAIISVRERGARFFLQRGRARAGARPRGSSDQISAGTATMPSAAPLCPAEAGSLKKGAALFACVIRQELHYTICLSMQKRMKSCVAIPVKNL